MQKARRRGRRGEVQQTQERRHIVATHQEWHRSFAFETHLSCTPQGSTIVHGRSGGAHSSSRAGGVARGG